MKKIITIFSVCWLALCFYACQKPELEPEPDPNNPDSQEECITVSFNGESWSPSLSAALYHEGYDAIDIRAYKSGVQDYPFAFVCFYGSQTGTRTDRLTELAQPPVYATDLVEYVEYYESHTFHDEEGYLYGDWWANSVSITVNQFDAATLACDFSCTATMFSIYDISFLGLAYEQARTAPMTVTAHVTLATE